MQKIGIDLGGTNLRAALLDKNGVIKKIVVPCPADANDPMVVLDAIAGLIDTLYNPEVQHIGIGVPSIVNVSKGIVYDVANIPSWKEVHLKDYMRERFPGVRICINNDANCFALGEATYGAAKGKKNVVGLALGTGTGAGIIIDGKLYNGAGEIAGAGEVGYLPYKESFFENYTCGSFFNNRGIDSKQAANLARESNTTMQALWQEFGGHVGALIKALLLVYDPETIVIGGGIADAHDLYEQALRESLTDFYYPRTVKALDLCFSTTPDAALLGAAVLCNTIGEGW